MMPSWLTVLLLTPLVVGLDLPNYEGLLTSQKPGVLEVTFHNRHSTTNLWNRDTLFGLTDIVRRLQNDNETKAVVFKSDVPKYFLNHLDLQIEPFDPTVASRTIELLYNMTNLPQVTIAAVEGIARGAGNEFLISLDIRFATKAHTLLGQPEVGMGLMPGGGGGQYLPRLIGRGRAMEFILSSKDVTAEDAEEMGWINRAFDTSAEMHAHIDNLVSRLVLFPLGSLGAAKQSINRATRPPLEDLLMDAESFLERLANPAVQTTIARALTATSNQSDSYGEQFLGEAIPTFYN
ncbi:hypothetical protein CNMCM8927_000699 [Aspergillus lentulus]|uniref:Uncharacterized protein n=1 Tax=Aspergillus lentulus TaxID=293939 RepID=A0AAN5YJ47_ASPLE|nr:hypothetical protein CNMCM8927_000699 [Aspergillus lentulus]GFF79923.1 short-chain-enoyl-CoA hydratase [Aspergillus lentulus]